MKLTKLKIKSYPPIEDRTFHFVDDCLQPLNKVALIGPNASGKTRMLELLTSLLGGKVIRNIEKDFSISASFAIKLKNPDSLKRKLSLMKLKQEVTITNTEVTFSFDNSKYGFKHLYAFEKVSEVVKELTDENILISHKSGLLPTESMTILNPYRNTNTLMLLANRIQQELINDVNTKSRIFEINKILREIDPKLYITLIEGTIKFKGRLDIKQLSSGEQLIVAQIIFLNLYSTNKSIVLIDEPEISLHINWQQLIIPALVKAAKNKTQILIATHSPEIIKSFDSKELIFMSEDRSTNTFGLNTLEIMHKVMGYEDRQAEEIDKKIKRYTDLLSQKPTENQEKELKKLKNFFNEVSGTSDISRLIQFIEMQTDAKDLSW